MRVSWKEYPLSLGVVLLESPIGVNNGKCIKWVVFPSEIEI